MNNDIRNMKHYLLLPFVLLVSMTSNGQKHVYEDLLALYVDEAYEKCISKAENYTEGDDTRKDPLPYLYISMAFYEMSKKEEFNEDYPKASRDALKYAEKYRKKDKNSEFFRNYEDYWEDLNTMCMEEAENFIEEESWSKAKRYYDYMISYYPENPGAWLMLVYSEIRYNQVREAQLHLKEFEKAYREAGDISRLPPDQKELLSDALIRYTEYLQNAGMRDSARTTMALGKDHFMEDAEFKALFKEVN